MSMLQGMRHVRLPGWLLGTGGGGCGGGSSSSSTSPPASSCESATLALHDTAEACVSVSTSEPRVAQGLIGCEAVPSPHLQQAKNEVERPF